MARVPVSQGPRVQADPLAQQRFRAADDGGGVLAGLGEGMQRLGRAGQDFAEQERRNADMLADTGAKTYDNEFVAGAQAIRAGYLGQQGLNAQAARTNAEQDLRRLRDDVLAKTGTKQMRDMLRATLDQRVTLMQGEFLSHESAELLRANDSSSLGRIAMSGEEAVSTTDPILRRKSIDTGIGEIDERARRLGWTSDFAATERLKFESGIHRAHLEDLITADDVDGALGYLTSNAGRITSGDELSIRKALRDPLQTRETNRDVSRVFGIPAPASTEAPEAPVVGRATLFRTIVNIESRGKQFGRDGKPLISSAGAVGIAQVMPATGPEAARLAGVTWDETRFRTDAAYNSKLGEAYYNKQLRDFGDPVLAAAAYNAGPGRIRQALAKGGDWTQHIPAETRDYVRKFRSGVPAEVNIQQEPERHDLNELLGRVDVLAQTEGWTPERTDRAKQMVERRASRDEALLARSEADAQRRAYDVIDNLPGNRLTSMNQLPPDVRARLTSSARMQLEADIKTNTAPTANGSAIITLHQLAILKPEDFARTELRAYRNQMTPAEYDDLARLQARIVAKPNAPEVVSHSRVWQMINFHGPAIGADATGKKRGEDDTVFSKRRTDAQVLFTRMQNYLNALTERKRQPTDDEVKRAFDNAVIERRLPDGTTGPNYKDTTLPMNSVVVPSTVGASIRARLRGLNLPHSDRDVALVYMQGR